MSVIALKIGFIKIFISGLKIRFNKSVFRIFFQILCIICSLFKASDIIISIKILGTFSKLH